MTTWNNDSFSLAFEKGELGRKNRYGTLHVHHFDSCSFLCISLSDPYGGGKDEILAMRFPDGLTVWNTFSWDFLRKCKTQQYTTKIVTNFSSLQDGGGDITKSYVVDKNFETTLLDICQKKYVMTTTPPANKIINPDSFSAIIVPDGEFNNKTSLLQVPDKCAKIDEALDSLIPEGAEFLVNKGWWIPQPEDFIPPNMPTEADLQEITFISTPAAFNLPPITFDYSYDRIKMNYDRFPENTYLENQFKKYKTYLSNINSKIEYVLKNTTIKSKYLQNIEPVFKEESKTEIYDDGVVVYIKGFWKLFNKYFLPLNHDTWYKLESLKES